MALAQDAKKGVFQAASKKGAIRPVHKSINTMDLLEKFGGKETNGAWSSFRELCEQDVWQKSRLRVKW